MSDRSRSALTLVVALTIAAAAAPLRAQDAVSVPPARDSVPVSPAAAETRAPVGPTAESAALGVRHAPAEATESAQRRGGYGQPVALMVVGGAAVLVGLIIGGGAGAAIAVGGAIAGLYGLYQYLQ
jgi:hypothetical protein